MDEKIVEQILDELFSSFEKSETESAAILLFLKGEGIATEEKLAPYVEQASTISEVRWRAARVRMGALLASAMKTPEAAPQKTPAPAQEQDKEHQEEEKKEPEKNAGPKAGVKAETGSEQAAKEESDGVPDQASESTKPVKAETESAQKDSDERTEDKAAVLQKPTKS